MGCNAEAEAGFCLWLLPLRTEGRSVFLVRDLLHQNGAGNENRVPLNTQATSNKNASRNSFFCSLPCSCPAAELFELSPPAVPQGGPHMSHVSPSPADGTRLIAGPCSALPHLPPPRTPSPPGQAQPELHINLPNINSPNKSHLRDTISALVSKPAYGLVLLQH